MNEDEIKVASVRPPRDMMLEVALADLATTDEPITPRALDSGKVQCVQTRSRLTFLEYTTLVRAKGEDGAKEYLAERLCVDLARALDETGATRLSIMKGVDFVDVRLSLEVLIRE